MALLLALLTAASYGVGDFSGGLASRRASPISVTATAHTIGLAGLIVASAIVGAEHIGVADLAFGAGAGAFGCLGILLLYRGLAGGQMAIVSPVSALIAAVVPVAGGLLAGERPGAIALIGILVALVAIGLVSTSGPMGRPTRQTLTVAVGSGIGFGMYFLLISHVHEEAGLWPLACGRVVSMVIAVGLAFHQHLPVLVARDALPLTVAAGALDVTANVSFLLASQQGLLSIVAAVSSLYPAATVLLAIAVTGERLSRTQGIGLVAAGGALVLVAV